MFTPLQKGLMRTTLELRQSLAFSRILRFCETKRGDVMKLQLAVDDFLGFYIQWWTPHQSIGLLWLHWWWSCNILDYDPLRQIYRSFSCDVLNHPAACVSTETKPCSHPNALRTSQKQNPETHIAATSNSLRSPLITLGSFFVLQCISRMEQRLNTSFSRTALSGRSGGKLSTVDP